MILLIFIGWALGLQKQVWKPVWDLKASDCLELNYSEFQCYRVLEVQ